MQIKKIFYYLSKFTLLDEIAGILYWAIAIYGMFYLIESELSATVKVLLLSVYITTIVFVYFKLLRKVTDYFKKNGNA